jgi:hypothetical protein
MRTMAKWFLGDVGAGEQRARIGGAGKGNAPAQPLTFAVMISALVVTAPGARPSWIP